jgi:hypothetical protein
VRDAGHGSEEERGIDGPAAGHEWLKGAVHAAVIRFSRDIGFLLIQNPENLTAEARRTRRVIVIERMAIDNRYHPKRQDKAN